MSPSPPAHVGFTCAYAPLPLIMASGLTPFRVLPFSQASDRAGRYLHDNLCPHVKRVLDRALDDDLPPLAGMLVVNSCDAMRRLADAWQQARPQEPVFVLDLPATRDAAAARFLATEFERLAAALAQWGGQDLATPRIAAAVKKHNRVCASLDTLREKMARGVLAGGRARLQALYNQAGTMAADEALGVLAEVLAEESAPGAADGVPVYLFGNLFADPAAWDLIEASGARVAGDDFCTGARLFNPVSPTGSDPCTDLARSLLGRPPCARTFDADDPGMLARRVVDAARACQARAVIGHTVKFCDPYLARLPMIRDALREAKLPLMMLEGDCTLGSMGQQRTRLEAFIEMLR
jgi:benzoyl-CoA reductase/2-hydroxyglutaryl-CoA dehydratase subunit BcrC/BadD/HgdB